MLLLTVSTTAWRLPSAPPRYARSPPACWRLSAPVQALSEALPMQLAELSPGDVLKQSQVKGAHNGKLFLRVPVLRAGSKPVDAQLNLPRKHPLLSRDPAQLMGQNLTVFVRRANTADGTLHVSLSDPKDEVFSLAARRRAADRSEVPRTLEELVPGQQVRGTVLSCHQFGCFVAAGVSRAGRAGRRAAVDGLLPLDQLAEGVELVEQRPQVNLVWPDRKPGDAPRTRQLRVGDVVEARVLQALPGAGRLLLTMSDATREQLEAAREAARTAKRRGRRRAWVGDARLKPGVEREGVVTGVGEQGMTVNVGARFDGFVPRSLLRGDIESAPPRGTRVLVRVRPDSTRGKLVLSFVRALADSDKAGPGAAAVRRRGERAVFYTRAEDGALGLMAPRRAGADPAAEDEEGDAAAAAAAQEDEMWAATAATEEDAMWAAQEEEEDDDDGSWAAAPPPSEEDFAWAMRDAPPQGTAADAAEDDEEDDGSWAADDGLDDAFDDNYLEDKYG